MRKNIFNAISLFSLLVISVHFTGCKKPDAPTTIEIVKPTGSFVFYNNTKDVYRIEVWRYNSGGQIPSFYTVQPSQSMVIANSIVGKYVIGILQMSGYTSTNRVDYGFEAEITTNSYFEYTIK